MMIIGDLGLVYPAAEIPFLAASRGAVVVEINVSPTPLLPPLSAHFIEGSASRVLPKILIGLELPTA